MKIETLENGQIVITKGDLKLIHTDVKGVKFNDCTVNNEPVSQWDIRFKELFIELHIYKNYGKLV